MNKNYSLFEKYLSKISAKTISRFGSLENIALFLSYISTYGNIAAASKKIASISVMQMPILIKQDKNLEKCVSLSLSYAAEVAEGVLYDRAINGYEELSYNKTGECIARKRKYCSKSLLEYLKANSVKYQTKTAKGGSGDKKACNAAAMNAITSATNFEIEDYGAKTRIE